MLFHLASHCLVSPGLASTSSIAGTSLTLIIFQKCEKRKLDFDAATSTILFTLHHPISVCSLVNQSGHAKLHLQGGGGSYKCSGAGGRRCAKVRVSLCCRCLGQHICFVVNHKQQQRKCCHCRIPFYPPPRHLFNTASRPLTAPLHMPLYTQRKHDFHLYCIAWGA